MLDWNRWPHFSREELKCPHCGRAPMDPDFMDKVEALRVDYGEPVVISSGYRCPEYNDKISSTGRDGPHTTGKAVDIPVSAGEAHRLLFYAMKRGFSGVGIKQHGEHDKRFIHLDDLTEHEEPLRPWVWTYE